METERDVGTSRASSASAVHVYPGMPVYQPVDFESFSIDIGRLIDAGNVVVMQGHYVGKGNATGKSVRAAVAHVLEISDGKIVRFDQYVDSATINPIIGA